jgi:beta-lactamase superfamily II metal-dependent hydrolase
MHKVGIKIIISLINVFCVLIFLSAPVTKPVLAIDTCGTGSWTTGNLEVHHINIGQGDATLIVGPTGKSLLFDAGESYWNSNADAHVIGPYIESVLGCKSLDYAVISHFHVDHIGYVGYGGLWHLVETQGFTIGTTLVRDYNTYLGDTSSTFTNWKAYLEGVGQTTLHPRLAIEGTGQVNLGTGVTFDIVAVNGNGAIIAGNFSGNPNPPSENDYSIGALLSFGNFDEWIGGDLDGQYETSDWGYTYHDIELSVAPEVGDVDIYKVNHHSSLHSSSVTWLNQLDPEVSIVTVGNGNSYGHPTQNIMDRLLATSVVYMTERGNPDTDIGSAIVAGHIIIKTSNGSTYTVNGTPFAATEPARTDVDEDGFFAEADPNDNNSTITPDPAGGCDPLYQTCSVSCQISPGQVVINEFLPSPSNNGTEWIELYNTTDTTLNLGYCYIDDIIGASPASQIPASTLIPAHGFWTLDQNGYFNNAGDDVRFLKEDASTVLDSYSYGNTASDLSRYRLPDGGPWASTPTSSTTKGQTNTLPYYPIVLSVQRVDENPSSADSVAFTITFSKPVTGVNTGAPFDDFALATTGMTGSSIISVSGSGAIYNVVVTTGTGTGTIRLDIADNDSIRDAANHPLGGAGAGNGNFSGATYTIARAANLDISLAGNVIESYYVIKNNSKRQSYLGLNNGPVKILNTASTNIIASQRVIYGGVSYSEMMGLPFEQLTNEYLFPYYNNVAMDSQLRVSNVGGSSTTIKVYLGTQQIDSYTLAAGGATRKNYSNKNTGPLRVTSSASDILATIRVLYGGSSYSEMMGLPVEQLAKEYIFPYYNNVAMDSQLRVSNVGGASTTIKVYLGSSPTPIDQYTLAAGGATRKNYTGKNSGPLRVVSSDSNILTTVRVLYENSSYSELMGFPTDLLRQEYWFPVYDNVAVNSQLRVSNVGTDVTTITIYAGTEQIDSYSLNAGAATRKNYGGKNTGPLHVVSSSQPVLTTIRLLYAGSSYYELTGLPDSQLSTQYFFPWYNNKAMSSELRFAEP